MLSANFLLTFVLQETTIFFVHKKEKILQKNLKKGSCGAASAKAAAEMAAGSFS